MTKSRLNDFLKVLGPGILFAGTSIGVSHIVQSTRAGAMFGFGILWAVIFANVFKFPFFEFAPRYVVATGDHLLHGYRKVGKWAFYLFCILSLCTMFPIQAAVTLVCTGLFANILHWTYPAVYLSAIILFICSAILLLGKYPFLDKLMKVMIVVLGISTVVAFITAAVHGPAGQEDFIKGAQNNWVHDIGFVIALMGWMPTTLEISVWHSFWTAERKQQTDHQPKLKDALLDFHIGYWGTMVMAALFLSLGALVMYGTGEEFSPSAVKFTSQVLTLFTKALGSWSYWIIAIAAATTMFSTTLACLDAFPRVAREAITMIFPSMKEKGDKIYFYWLVFVCLGSLLIIGQFVHKLKTLVDFATTVAFLATPVFAFINLKTVTSSHMPSDAKPGKRLIIFSWICLFLLSAFCCVYIYSRFIK